MKQYIDLIKEIKESGTYKKPARENMPGTYSLFGTPQFVFNLQDGFPAVTTKKLYWKGVVTELLWFLRGDTHIKYLDDHGCRKMWHQDAYNYYVKIACKYENDSKINVIYVPCNNKTNSRNCPTDQADSFSMFTFDEFCNLIKNCSYEKLAEEYSYKDYVLGDCGMQYGKLWRDWPSEIIKENGSKSSLFVDQVQELIKSLSTNPEGRRHIISAWNPSTLNDMALNACHSFVQFNCRPIPWEIKLDMAKRNPNVDMENLAITEAAAGHPHWGIPQYYLDCKMYQRSADLILGVPLNIASYALLTHILCKLLNFIPGNYIHTFGDVHLYEDQMNAVNEQILNKPLPLPNLQISDNIKFDKDLHNLTSDNLTALFESWNINDFQLENYQYTEVKEKANLSTGMKKH